MAVRNFAREDVYPSRVDNDPRMTDPTLGVLARNRFFFNANGQWEEKDESRQLEALVLSVPVR